MQGQSVAKCFGSFQVTFPDRELPYDKVVNVLLLEWLEVTPLEQVDSSRIDPRKRKIIRKNVIDTIKSVYKKGVYIMSIDFNNFLLDNGRTTTKMHGFSFAYSGDQLEPGESDRLPDMNIDCMEYWMDAVRVEVGMYSVEYRVRSRLVKVFREVN